MMINQLCAGAEQGSAGLEKAVLYLPVPLEFRVFTRYSKCTPCVVNGKDESDWEVI